MDELAFIRSCGAENVSPDPVAREAAREHLREYIADPHKIYRLERQTSQPRRRHLSKGYRQRRGYHPSQHHVNYLGVALLVLGVSVGMVLMKTTDPGLARAAVADTYTGGWDDVGVDVLVRCVPRRCEAVPTRDAAVAHRGVRLWSTSEAGSVVRYTVANHRALRSDGAELVRLTFAAHTTSSALTSWHRRRSCPEAARRDCGETVVAFDANGRSVRISTSRERTPHAK